MNMISVWKTAVNVVQSVGQEDAFKARTVIPRFAITLRAGRPPNCTVARVGVGISKLHHTQYIVDRVTGYKPQVLEWQ